jgi:hypothetical protein
MTPDPIRIYCGADRSQRLALRVLEHSIRRHTTRTVEVTAIDNGNAPTPRDPRHSPYTEFSFARFAIPALAGRRGKALYMDSDMLVFRDIAELWDQPFDGAKVLIEVGSRQQRDRGKHAAVMLLDCAALDWDVASIVAALGTRYDYNQLLAIDPLLAPGEMVERIPAGWNDLDRYLPGHTRNLHYTEIRTQPWVCASHPHGHLWIDELKRALAAGAVHERLIEDEIAEGHARPSLAIELGLAAGANPADREGLAAFDRTRRFVPHAKLLARFAARKRAIRAFERERAIAARPWLGWWYRLRYRDVD